MKKSKKLWVSSHLHHRSRLPFPSALDDDAWRGSFCRDDHTCSPEKPDGTPTQFQKREKKCFISQPRCFRIWPMQKPYYMGGSVFLSFFMRCTRKMRIMDKPHRIWAFQTHHEATRFWKNRGLPVKADHTKQPSGSTCPQPSQGSKKILVAGDLESSIIQLLVD